MEELEFLFFREIKQESRNQPREKQRPVPDILWNLTWYIGLTRLKVVFLKVTAEPTYFGKPN